MRREASETWCSGTLAEDPAFDAALLREGIDTMLAREIDTGKTIQGYFAVSPPR